MITEIFTESEQQNCEIRIRVRSDKWGPNNEFWGIQIDNTITPLFCCNCKTQLRNFYKLSSGRYGEVGTVECSCGAKIQCFDSDNIVDYLNTITSFKQNSIDKYHIDYTKMYKLENIYFSTIRDKVGFDIFHQYADQTIDLKKIIEELEHKYGLKTESELNFSFDKIERLPKTINKWLTILDNINK